MPQPRANSPSSDRGGPRGNGARITVTPTPGKAGSATCKQPRGATRLQARPVDAMQVGPSSLPGGANQSTCDELGARWPNVERARLAAVS
jgi:hypothetical protein